jgi:hypothetical protein
MAAPEETGIAPELKLVLSCCGVHGNSWGIGLLRKFCCLDKIKIILRGARNGFGVEEALALSSFS